VQSRQRHLADGSSARVPARRRRPVGRARRLSSWLAGRAQALVVAASLAAAAAAIVAPLGLMAAAGWGILRALAPEKSVVDVNAALAEGDIDFIDRFTRLNTGRWVVSHGWSNGNWMENEWRREQVAITPEGLDITLAANVHGTDKPYASGEIATHEAYLYGYYEARMRVPRGGGLVVGFFTFTRPEGRSSWHEIDMEFLGRDSRWLELTHHVEGQARRRVIVLPFDAAEEFHTYAFEWRPDVLRWYVDNVLVHEARGPEVTRLNRPQRFFINVWNSRELHRWVGRIDPEAGPHTLTVSCVARAAEYRGVSLCSG
jgi:beta-glucanase (GH16 family)